MALCYSMTQQDNISDMEVFCNKNTEQIDTSVN